MKKNKESTGWHNYGEWHNIIYKHPTFDECLSMLKAYYLRTIGTIPPNLHIVSITQDPYATDYIIAYRLRNDDDIFTIKSDMLRHIQQFCQDELTTEPLEECVPYDQIKVWVDAMMKPIDDIEPGKRYKIISNFYPEGDDSLCELEGYKTELSLNEARRLLGQAVYACVFCGGGCYKTTENSATVQFDGEDFPITFKIESIR